MAIHLWLPNLAAGQILVAGRILVAVQIPAEARIFAAEQILATADWLVDIEVPAEKLPAIFGLRWPQDRKPDQTDFRLVPCLCGLDRPLCRSGLRFQYR